MTAPVVDVHNLTKRFGDFTAVDGISFEIRPGEILGLLGPNGAGKTTTIQMLLGLVTPTSGSIRMFGRDLVQDPSSWGDLRLGNALDCGGEAATAVAALAAIVAVTRISLSQSPATQLAQGG